MESINKFEDLNICAELKKAVLKLGFSEMFPIQQEAIPRLLEGKDLIGQAKTGTGKTAAFGIPIIEKINVHLNSIQALILVPTRELAVQVNKEISKLGEFKRIRSTAIYGGTEIRRQIKELQNGVDVVVGTPGRIIDHLERRTIRFSHIKTVILDEADVMLDMGFVNDIKFILENTPRDRQTALFSATMPEDILHLANKYMKEHEVLKVSKDEITVNETEQMYCEVDVTNKVANLVKIFESENVSSAIIFCNTKNGVRKLLKNLHNMKYSVEAIHGNLSQAQRNKVMNDFRAGKFKILIATDVAARGLDIKGVSHIINYNVPKDPKTYVHRIGRTGRAGGMGKAILFITSQDEREFRDIKKYINMELIKVDYKVPFSLTPITLPDRESGRNFNRKDRRATRGYNSDRNSNRSSGDRNSNRPSRFGRSGSRNGNRGSGGQKRYGSPSSENRRA